MNAPTQFAEHLLPQTIPVTSYTRTVVFRPIAFDPKHASSFVLRVDDGKINAKTGTSNLLPDLVPGGN
jgi:hypothetical protein